MPPKNRRSQPPPSGQSDRENIQLLLAFIFGVVFLVVMLVIAIFFPEPTQFQYLVFRIILSLAAAGVGAMLPGLIRVQIPKVVQAGGALAVFVIVFFYNPASLVTDSPSSNGGTEDPWVLELQNLRGDLGNIEGIWERLDESSTGCSVLRNKAPNLGRRFEDIEDENLPKLGKRIEKYRYAQNAYLIASDVECDLETAKDYAEKSIEHGGTALKLIEEARQIPGKYGQDLRTWLDNDFTADRIYFHNALGHALLHYLGVPNEVEKVKASLDTRNIRREYYVQSNVNPETNGILKPILNPSSSEQGASSVHLCLNTC